VPVSRTYRCLNCMEGTVIRSYDVSHLTRSCDVCGEFDRHVNQRVVDQYEAFEADPPDALNWASLDRTRKLVVAERVARHGRSVESLARNGEGDAVDAPEPAADAADERTPVDAAIAGESADTTAPEDGESADAAERDPDEETDEGTDADAESDTAGEPDPDEESGDAETESNTGTGHDSTPSGSD